MDPMDPASARERAVLQQLTHPFGVSIRCRARIFESCRSDDALTSDQGRLASLPWDGNGGRGFDPASRRIAGRQYMIPRDKTDVWRRNDGKLPRTIGKQQVKRHTRWHHD